MLAIPGFNPRNLHLSRPPVNFFNYTIHMYDYFIEINECIASYIFVFLNKLTQLLQCCSSRKAIHIPQQYFYIYIYLYI